MVKLPGRSLLAVLRTVDLTALLLQADGVASSPAGEALAALAARYAEGAQAPVADMAGVPEQLGLHEPISMRHVRQLPGGYQRTAALCGC